MPHEPTPVKIMNANGSLNAAMLAIEELDADERLTDAVALIDAAKRRLNDFAADRPGQRTHPYQPAMNPEREAGPALRGLLSEALETIPDWTTGVNKDIKARIRAALAKARTP